MSNVVLISPPYVKDYMRNARCDFVSLSNSSWYPIWLAQAGAYIESRGHRTRMLDAQVMDLTHEQALQQISDFDADVVVVYTGRLSEDNDIEFGDRVARDGLTVVFAGPYTSIDPQSVLKKAEHVKLAVRREFDLPIEELASGQAPADIQNFVIKDASGEITANEVRPLYKTEILDTFPNTTPFLHRQVDIYRYKSPELFPFMDVMSGRGCAWGRCNFCLWVQTFVPGSVYNLRSIDHFMGEFDYIVNSMPEIRSVMIQDDMLTNKRAREISEAILERGYDIRWSCYAKPNSKLSRETLRLMARSGCLNLHVGFESGDDDVLDKIDKGSTVAQAKEFAEMVHEAGLRIHGDFAMGHFGETKDSMQRTLELAREINPHTAQFQLMIPFKGTKFHDQLDEAGAWSKSGEPTYEHMGGASSEEIRSAAKAAYRSFYISMSYLKRVIAEPREYFFNRLDQYVRAIPAVTWRRWQK
ncbi:MAG: radical SAM protein [Myxococcales bacterium]|nr:radical SAM protein [Myxococcales bacterium]